MSERSIVILAGVLGFSAVALGAFGAHGLETWLSGAEGAEARAGWWDTGARYHLAHALGTLGLGWLRSRAPGRATSVAAVAFAAGVILFSGSLYAMALGGPRWLGAVTPLGGLSFLVGWAATLAAGSRIGRG